MNKELQIMASMVNNHFGNNLVFAVVFGSRARMEHRKNSDVDLLVVHKLSRKNITVVDAFKKDFGEYQAQLGLEIDYKYLGEYITIKDLQKSIDGYGFIKDDKTVLIERIGKNDWNLFNEYRQWLSCLATPNICITGDKDEYNKIQHLCLKSSILLSILANYSQSFSLENIIDDLVNYGKDYLGFCSTEKTKLYLLERLPKLFEELTKEKLLTVNTSGYLPDRDLILKKFPQLLDLQELKFKENFLGINTTEETRKLIGKCVNIGIDFLINKKGTLNYYSEDEIKERFREKIPAIGSTVELILDEYKKSILDGSVHQNSPNYLAFPDTGNAVAAIMADILVAFTNQNLIATTKSAPTATFAEIQVIQWFRELVGFPLVDSFPESALEVGGIITASGTQANTTALLVARCKTFPESRKNGLGSLKVKPILIVAADTLYHYSHIASFWWLGLGEENIVYINTLKDYRLDCEDLDNKLKQYNNGVTSKVVMVISQAGDSRTTTIENFKKVAEIVKKHNVWLHVDGCHGGVLLFSKSHRERMDGIELANSISIDPHKGLCVPYPSSIVLFRDTSDLILISKSTDITIQKGSYDLGQITPFVGSRPFDSLKLWFLIKNLGVKGINQLVEYRYNLAKSWHKKILSSRFFVTLNNVELNSVVFSVSPDKLIFVYPKIKIDREFVGKLNKLIHDYVYKEGYLCIHTFDIVDAQKAVGVDSGKLRVLGVTFGNPYTMENDFVNHISYLDDVASKLIETI